MIIKKFVAETMSEALALVRKELGNDAVILKSTKVEKGGMFSFLGREMVEVTAATPDYNPLPPREADQDKPSETRDSPAETAKPSGPRHQPKTHMPPPPPPGAYAEQTGQAKPRRPAPEPTTGEKTHERNPSSPAVSSHRGNGRGDSPKDGIPRIEFESMRTELTDLRGTMEQLATHMKYQSAPALPEELAKRWRALVDNGMTERLAHDLTQRLSIELGKDELTDGRLIDKKLRSEIARAIPTGRLPEKGDGVRPLVISLIGPTGVGKTTTLAKMATNRKIYGGLRVALISTDTYRVAAVEQLKTFAAIAGLPVEVVYRAEEMEFAIRKHADKDVILVDTAGRSQNDQQALEELGEFVDTGDPDEVILVLSAGTRLRDQAEMIERFGQIRTTRVVLSKLDEVTTAGHLYELAGMLPREWVFLTTGQDVPDDILPARADLLAALISDVGVFKRLREERFDLEAIRK
ncbi:flagellar biosynthesis protein FlhF [bacterium]|nr:flagellar biosynthesis protein FlhF [bacterium]